MYVEREVRVMPGVSCCGVMNDIEERWRGILKRRPFPRVYAGVEVEGIELVSLDTFCIAVLEVAPS